MILYVNGDSHSAGAEIIGTYCFAYEQFKYQHLGRKPHPECVELSFGKLLSEMIGGTLYMDAESASSNDRIIRTTREYVKTNTPSAIVIGWTSWEREEWEHDGGLYQVSGWCSKDWPQEVKDRHKEWAINVDYNQKRNEWHEKIWQFHNELKDIPHLFFNAFSSFTKTPIVDWGDSYIGPYDDSMSYRNWLTNHGFKPVRPDSYHFGADAHKEWAQFLLPHLTNVMKK